MSRKGSLSATNLAIHHHLSCDLYLHNVYHGPTGHAPASISSTIARAQFERGIDWESLLFSWLDKENLLLTVPSTPLQADELSENIQADDRHHFFIAGLTFWPPKDALNARFLKKGAECLNFGLSKLDLLEITRAQDGSIIWSVIDAKASSDVKTSHHIQIYFYTLCLTYLLKNPPFVPSGKAAIWLPPAEGFSSSPPSLDDLRAIRIALLASSLDDFLFRQLPRILSLSREMVEWHYNPLCRSCPYDIQCRSRALRDGELGSIPNISLEDARILKRLLIISHEEQYLPKRREEPVTDIEELHKLIADQSKIGRLEQSFPLITKKARRILGLSARNRNSPQSSAIIEAARTNTIRIKPQRNFTCPRREDIAVIISLVLDPLMPGSGIGSFCLSVFSAIPSFRSPDRMYGDGESLVPAVARLIRTILDLRHTLSVLPSTQFYVFSTSEQDALQNHLINSALTSAPSDRDIRLCIGALAQGASLLQTTFQPLLLSGALLGFLSVKGTRTREELQKCLERMDRPTEGTTEQLRIRLQDEVRRLQREGGRVDEDRRTELGQLPRVVIVKREIERSIALPIPGYWDLSECASTLLPEDTAESRCPSDEDIFNEYRNGGTHTLLDRALEKRNLSMFAVLRHFRELVSSNSRRQVFVNDARILSANFMDLCKEDNLRKLFFMQQFEMLTKLTELWRSRIDGCPDAPILEYKSTRQGRKGIEHLFLLVSGALDMPAVERERSFYDYLLVQDENVDDDINGETKDDIPVEALFDDLGVSGLVFPLNKYTKQKWNAQHSVVQRKLMVAELRDIIVEKEKTMVTLQTWGGWDVMLITGRRYRFSPRLVDFNVTKILSTLIDLDLQYVRPMDKEERDQEQSLNHVPFIQLILDPRSLLGMDADPEFRKKSLSVEQNIQKSFRELNELGIAAAGALVLMPSQHVAARRILSNRLSVIWGPPGTGKTYTIALSLLRLLDVQHRLGDTTRKIIFITAMTHAAIEACLKKFSYLLECYRAIDSMPVKWLDDLKVEHILKGNEHPAPPNQESSAKLVYAGTVYQLYNFTKRLSFQVDCVIIDEAGQLALTSAALVLRSLSPTGRIVVAGDSEQLAPIFTAQYPQLKSRHIFGSILDCLMHMSSVQPQEICGPTSPTTTEGPEDPSSQGTIVQLTENFRLNPDLGEFVSTIYARAFRPQKVQIKRLAAALKSTSNHLGKNLGVQPDVLKDIQAVLLALSDAMHRQPQTRLLPPVHIRNGNLDPSVRKMHLAEEPDPHETPHQISLVLVRLQTRTSRLEGISYELHVRGEAAVAAALVTSLRRCSPTDDIFVATPHRIQRQAVKAALNFTKSHDEDFLVDAMEKIQLEGQPSRDVGKVTVDTIERLQGSEAAFVICLFSLPQSSMSDLAFLLDRRRLNVAISRTKTLCILVASHEVLSPSVKVLAKEQNAKGYAFLKAFEERAWSTVVDVDLDRF